MAALAQNGDGLRADQAGAPDNDDFHDLPPLVDDFKAANPGVNTQAVGLVQLNSATLWVFAVGAAGCIDRASSASTPRRRDLSHADDRIGEHCLGGLDVVRREFRRTASTCELMPGLDRTSPLQGKGAKVWNGGNPITLMCRGEGPLSTEAAV